MRLILNHFNTEYDLEATQGAHILFSVLKALPPLSAQGPWIAGGALRDLILNQTPKDYDIYFQSEPQRDAFIQGLINNGWIERPAEFVARRNKDPLKPYKVREFTRLIEHEGLQKTVIVQTIDFIDYPNPIKVISGFDFTCNQLITDGVNIYTGLTTMADLEKKVLRPFNLSDKTPAQFWYRLNYFLTKGFLLIPEFYSEFNYVLGELIKANPTQVSEKTIQARVQELAQTHAQAIDACTSASTPTVEDHFKKTAEERKRQDARRQEALKRILEMDDEGNVPKIPRIKVKLPFSDDLPSDPESPIWTKDLLDTLEQDHPQDDPDKL